MKKSVIRIVALVVAVLFVLVAVVPVLMDVYSEPYDDKVKEFEEKEKTALEQMQQYEKELNELSEQGRLLEEKRIAYEEELETVREELRETEKLEAEQQKKFRERFVTQCDQGAASYLEIIFSAQSISDLIENFVIVREISEYDKSIMETIERIKAEIVEKQNQLQELLKEIEEAETELLLNQSEVQQKLDEISAYIEQLEQDKEAYIQYLIEKEEAERRTKAQAGISGGVGTVDPGRIGDLTLVWPTNTDYITSHFSPNRVNPVTGVLRPHTGTDIGAGMGAPVWASTGGTVILAEYNGGYGNCVILDHGNGIKTLYGHMSSIMVSQGQSVGQGTQIGRVGSTGNSTGPHLHFEVLVDGVAVDPMQFF